jgi:hypothetical protein
LTNFPNGKQTQESLETGFPKTTFRETNTPLTVILNIDSINKAIENNDC